jgi:hypothetical protein
MRQEALISKAYILELAANSYVHEFSFFAIKYYLKRNINKLGRYIAK